MESGKALETLEILDARLEITSALMIQISVDHSEDAKEQNLASRSLEHKLDKLKSKVGSKPQALAINVNAPTLWGSIGDLGAKPDGVAQT